MESLHTGSIWTEGNLRDEDFLLYVVACSDVPLLRNHFPCSTLGY